MSDSDDDLLQSNIFTYANENTIFSARGPNVTNSNITGLSFRNNVLTSTMRMPVNFERQRYGGPNFDQRSMYYRREMSPMSLRGASDCRSGNYNRSIYRNGCRSMYNGRGVSPASVRSIDSTATVSAADIVFAFQNAKFGHRDLRIIIEAYNKLIRPHRRKKIEKRRNLRMLLKGSRRKSGEDSGEQGSDSSISSDDCRSIKTTTGYENIPGLNHMRDISHFSTNIRENQMVRDRTQSIKQNTFRNTFSANSSKLNYGSNAVNIDLSTIKDSIPSAINVQNMSTMSQKERFKKGYLLPSQRFSKSVVAPIQKGTTSSSKKNNFKPSCEASSGSESEEIFRGFSQKQTQEENISRKRFLEDEDIHCNKRKKLNPQKQIKNSEPVNASCDNHDPSHGEFIFAKPNLPITKCDKKRNFGPERLLAKSRVPVITEENNEFIVAQSNESDEKENNYDKANYNKNGQEENKNNNESDTLNPNSDLSMRPSFIKRKLFTQKLDVAENKNLGSDNIATNSPQNVYTEAIRERSRARKLVTSQSCLSREIAEDNNVLELIHKIVPPELINITNVANKTELSNDKSNHGNNDGKWDVTTAILNSNNQDISDTYTDEEIFNLTYSKDSTKSKEQRKISTQNSNGKSECKIFVKKLSPQTIKKCLKNNNNYELSTLKTTNERKQPEKKRVTDCVKSFWDTDFESDIEFSVASSRKTNTQINQGFIPQNKQSSPKSTQDNSIKKPSFLKGILTVRNGHKKQKLNISSKSQNNNTLREGRAKTVETPKSNAVVKANLKKPQLEKNKNDTNVVLLQTGSQKKTVNENVNVDNKQQETGKQCIDIINSNSKSRKQQITTDNKKEVHNKSSKNNKPALKPTKKSKDSIPKPKQTPDNKKTKSAQKSHTTSQKDTSNIRKQPTRKSKEKSLLQSQKPKTNSNKAKVTNNVKTKSITELVLSNSLHNSLNTRTTRSSREKLSIDTSGCDHSSINLSNLSNRSLRLRQRKINEYNAI